MLGTDSVERSGICWASIMDCLHRWVMVKANGGALKPLPREGGEGGCWPEMGEGGCHDDFSTTIRHKWVTVISAVVGQGPREGTGSVGRSGRPGRGMSGRGMGLSRHRNESQAHADRLGSVQDGGGAPAMMLVFEFASGLLTITCLSHLHSLLKPQTLTIAHLTRLCSSVAWTR